MIRFLSLLRRGHKPRAPLAEAVAPQPVLPEIPLPAQFARDSALWARSMAFEAACGGHLAVLDAALQTLDAAGKLRPDQLHYAAEHRIRFAEALHALAGLLGPQPGWPACRVLEVGSSITPMLFHQAFPALRLTSLCLFKHRQLEDVVEHDVQMDLEKLDLRGGAGLGVSHPGLEGLDMVMLCEVLEHLAVNPTNLFRALAATLRPGGLLYVTTPNFLRAGARALLLSGRNPQPLFPTGLAPAERFHHHIREYTMSELLDALEAAGLEPEIAYYSACWDDAEAAARLPPDARRNLVVAGRRPGGETTGPAGG